MTYINETTWGGVGGGQPRSVTYLDGGGCVYQGSDAVSVPQKLLAALMGAKTAHPKDKELQARIPSLSLCFYLYLSV